MSRLPLTLRRARARIVAGIRASQAPIDPDPVESETDPEGCPDAPGPSEAAGEAEGEDEEGDKDELNAETD